MKESNHRDRVEVQQLCIDDHVKAVLEFMQANVPSSKLCGVAEGIPQMTRLLCSHIPQESVICLSLRPPKAITSDQESQSHLTASE